MHISHSTNYSCRYELSNNQTRSETITILNKGTDQQEIVIWGYYTFIGPDGNAVQINYAVDKDGFRITPTPSVYLHESVIKSLVG